MNSKPETHDLDLTREWLEADGLGGFASGTSTGIRMRRYHALLLTATTPPSGRVVLVNGFDAWVETANGTFSLSSQCYHQGTVWPWLIGAFVDAWVWIHQNTPAAVHEARRVYLQPLLDHFEEGGLGHISEIADAEAPHASRGCPWPAWSVGEALWLDRVVLAEEALPATASSRLKFATGRAAPLVGADRRKSESAVPPYRTQPAEPAASR